MTQQLVIPEIQSAIDNLKASIAVAEKEIDRLIESRKQKRAEVRAWKKTLKALNGNH